jgi:predicted RecB family nuclease
MIRKITRDALEGYLRCGLKGHLRHRGERGVVSEYGRLLEQDRQGLRQTARRMALDRFPDAVDALGALVDRGYLTRGPDLILDAVVEDDLVSLRIDALRRTPGPSGLGDFHYIPVLFGEGGRERPAQRRLLEVCALVLGELQGRRPGKGILVDPERSAFAGVRFPASLRGVAALVDGLREVRDADSPPEPSLNGHCPLCEFQQRCRARAVETDHPSLLRGMGEQEIARLARRGIFTVTQLSYTFRARRATKGPWPGRSHSFALQALAIREKQTYVLGQPALPDGPVRIYFDIVGDAEKHTAYLIGMVVEGDGVERRFSFWADGAGEEGPLLDGFLGVVEGYPSARLYCYGSFEIALLKALRDPGRAGRIDQVLARTTNVLPIIYSSVYFPVYSNGLKEVGNCLGCRWTEPDASGLRCIAWRRRWEESRDAAVRRTIEAYNLEDCEALRQVVRFLLGIPADGEAAGPRPDAGPPAFARAEACPVPSSRREWCKARFAIPDFAHVNGLAYFDYQRDRVFVRGSRRLREARARARRDRRRKRHRIAERVEIRCRECPSCGGTSLEGAYDSHLWRIVTDLEITAGGIRRRFVRVTSPRYRCRRCLETFAPPDYWRVDRHGHSLKSWAMYEHVAHQVSFGKLSESFRECFGLSVRYPAIHGFKHLMARYYEETLEQLRARIIGGGLVHADETEVDVKGIGKAYVWVFTNLEEVIYLYRSSREGGFLHEYLEGFNGVLVSDFYTAYDSLPCAQQKCLIHLIRDFNHDILAGPFDEELRALAAEFGRLLRGAVTTIDRHGLSRKHLSRHRGDADRFLEAIASRTYRSEAARTYQARLEKYRGKLFKFLDHDGVPWNNNNAEHAIKAFANYRELVDGRLGEGGLIDYLALLSVCQTCAYKGVSFLKFLLSQETDIDLYCQGARSRRERLPYDLNPVGYIPPQRRSKYRREGLPS